jgi:hypothetical protein
MGKEAAVEQLQRIMKDEVHSEYFDDRGTFLPEGVLAKQGYDMDFIKARIAPDDVKEDRVLGTCYRIRLETTGNSGSRNITFSDGMRAAAKAVRGRKRKAIMDGSVGDMNDSSQHLAIEDGSVGGSDRNTASSSSSADNSSDSSSSDKKNSKKKKDKKRKDKKRKDKKKKDKKREKKGKDKKDKGKRGDKPESRAEQRAREALAKAKEKEEQRLSVKSVKDAETVLSKINAALETLKLVTDTPGAEWAPPMMRDPVMSAIEHFEMVAAECRKCIKKSGAGQFDLPDAKDIMAKITGAKRDSALLSSVLATMAKAASRR